jgi:hypothetical protein
LLWLGINLEAHCGFVMISTIWSGLEIYANERAPLTMHS